MKVVVNKKYGGFGLSRAAVESLAARGNKEAQELLEDAGPDEDVTLRSFERSDPDLVAVIEELGSKKASAPRSHLIVVNVPDDVKWYIDNDDGLETVEEVHRVFG